MDYPYETGNWNRYEIIVLPIALLVIIITAVLLGVFLKNKSLKARSIPLKIIAAVLLIAEIAKQILNIINGYSWGILPLHFCSLFVFFFPLSELMPQKIARFFKPVSVVTASAMSLLFYFGPNTIIGDSSYNIFFNDMPCSNFSEFMGVFYNCHTFFFHHLVILYFALSLALNLYTAEKKDTKKVLIVIECYVIIAMPIAHLTNTNFCSMLTGVVPFMETLRLAIGQWGYSLIMHIVLSGGCALITYAYYSISKLLTKKRS